MLVFALVTEQLTITPRVRRSPILTRRMDRLRRSCVFPPRSGMRALPKNFRDVAIAVAFQPPIHCSHSENVPVSRSD